MPLYSHSSLSAYENCPLSFKYRYVDRVERTGREGVEAFMGSQVHDALEKLYKDLQYTKVNSLDELLAYYHSQWDRQWHESIFIVKEGLTPEHYSELGARCISEYYNRFAPFNNGKVVGIEKAIILPLDESGEYKVRGFIDRLDYVGDGVYEIHDYKTSGNLMTQDYADRDRQLALYQMAVEKMHADVKDVRLVWHYLVFDKDVVSHRTHEQLDALRSDTLKLIDEIEQAKKTDDFPAKEGLCNWCDFPPICPRHKHEYEVVALTAREFKADEGVVLVDQYADLKAQAEEVTIRMEVARQMLLDYSDQKNADVVIGSGQKVSISRYSVTAYPSKEDARRAELEAVLKEAGLWEEVSTLDAAALRERIKSIEWPKAIVDRLRGYELANPRVTVRLSALNDDSL